jgi:hypothetical protein
MGPPARRTGTPRGSARWCDDVRQPFVPIILSVGDISDTEDGYFGRECPACEAPFKMRHDEYEALPDEIELTCPYCGNRKEHSAFMSSAEHAGRRDGLTRNGAAFGVERALRVGGVAAQVCSSAVSCEKASQRRPQRLSRGEMNPRRALVDAGSARSCDACART